MGSARHGGRRAATLSLLVLLGGPAHAAPASCHLLADRYGDGNLQLLGTYFEQMGQNATELDIVDGDISSGGRTVVVSLRLAGAGPPGKPQTATGFEWRVDWELGGVAYGVTLTRTPTGDAATFVVDSRSAPTYSYRVDEHRSTITWTLNRSALAPLRKTGQRFSRISAATAGYVGARWAADYSASQSTYADRARSCLPAG